MIKLIEFKMKDGKSKFQVEGNPILILSEAVAFSRSISRLISNKECDKELKNLYKEIYEEGINEALDDKFDMETFINYAVMRVNNYNISAELDKKS